MTIDKPLAFVLKCEGGKCDDPRDRGGRTAFGITQRVYDEWRDRKGLAQIDVWKIDQDEVKAIYDEQYWRAARCPVLPAPLDFVVFDSAVQHGVSRAVKWLQEVAEVKVDGVIGNATLAALKSANPNTLVAKYLDRRERFYDAIVANDPSQARFSKGWENRMNNLREEVGA